MIYVMLLAHLLGDYLLQFGYIARWKARSLVGVLVHGGIVTATTLVCAAFVSPAWWPYALLIGVTHTVIDMVRARLLHTSNPTWELVWYLLDQVAHLTVILGVVTVSNGNQPWTELAGMARSLADPRLLFYLIGYLLLAHPAWVLLRFTARGVWGPQAAPNLDQGEKYGPMLERVLIATCVLVGQFYLVPLVLLPRLLVPVRIQGRGVGVLVRPVNHWAERILGTLLALGIGLILRTMRSGS
ncbi:MAG: DUF3307 domain-containing protein [Anaerolineae bacterium]|nr:DUF3307 domain-containing protein [Anaerolineae bacterium]